MRFLANLRPGVLLLALAIAVFLWGIAHGRSSAEKGFDIPIELHKLDESLVVTDQSVDAVNIRVMGSRAALRNISPKSITFAIDVSGGKPGVAVYEVDVSRIEDQLPRGARLVSHSPSRIRVRLEQRGRKAVAVRVALDGQPAAGFHLAGVDIEPPQVWLTGARSQVMRLDEVGTETVNITGIEADEEREVRLHLGGGTVWMEKNEPVKLRIRVEPNLPAEPEPGPEQPAAEPQGGQGDD